MVDVAAQNPMCAALSTKSDENAYLSPLSTACVKRMAYARAVLKVDPEPALKLLADKIALRASEDGIQLKVETYRDSAVKASVQLEEHKTQWKDSMREARVGNTFLNRSDTRHGRMAMVGETRRMVA